MANGATALVRRVLRGFGFEIFRARGGIFICPTPHAAKPQESPTTRGATRLHLGCGNVRLDGYLNVDVVASPATDVVANIVSMPWIASGSCEEVRLDAVLEHLFRFERLSEGRVLPRSQRPPPDRQRGVRPKAGKPAAGHRRGGRKRKG